MKSCIIFDLENQKKYSFFPYKQLKCLEIHTWEPPIHSCYINFEF